MANQLGYVLDPFNQPTPVGVPGELHLGGVGVGWGYLDRPGLTAEKFVPNPYSGVPGDRMYRTGDLARYFPDGNLELLGRMDYQVKIRGHRIELGEIESTIKEHPSIREAVVVAKGERGGDQRLVGYLIPDFDQGGTAAELQKHDREQVDNWQSVYDETYGQEIPEADSTFNIIGWNSSYTGLPIPAEEMREWVDSTVDRIRRLRPRRILEIGCGTGLLLFRLAPDCERYVGLDISRVGLQYVQRQLDQRGLAHVTLLHQAADDLAGVEPSSFDLVILNSITQLFPSVDYLLKVLGGALGAVSPGGHVFIGDNRNLRLGEALHASIQVAQAPASIPLSDLPGRIRKSFKQEEQLLLDPRFFEALAGKDQRITAATVEIKHGKHHNELTRYRYDVTLTVGSESYPSDPERLHWLDDSLSIETLRRSLGEKRTRDLLVSAIPNARLRSDRHALELIAGPEDLTDVGSLRSALQGSAPGGDLDPEDLWIIADEHGYVAVLGYSELAGDLSFDALFIPRDRYSTPPPMPARILSPARWAEYANQPLKSKLRLGLPPQLHRFLADRLPDYMVPATFVLLDKLPLTPNGKVDRKNLPEPDHARPELGAPMLEPRNALEKVLAQIWEEIIGVDRVGVLDSFLELGGHSLLATQIQSRIRALLSVEIPLRHFFGKLTVEKLAGDVRAAGQTAGVDVESAAEMVLHYGQLPVEDIQQLLERGPAQ
jgi:SAM-dependent methyltransferase